MNEVLIAAAIGASFTGFLGIVGTLLLREMGRSDQTGIKASRSSESIASLNANYAAMQEEIARIESAHLAQSQAQNSAMEAVRTTIVEFGSAIARLQATMDALRGTVENLIAAERERQRQPAPVAVASTLDQFKQFIELQRLLKSGA